MFKQLQKNPKMIVILIGVSIIPILYSFFYLWAFWDPYGHLSSVPVAVVNDDQGASINGEQRNLGNEVVQRMKTSNDLKWIFVSSNSTARAGVEAGQYYTAVFIPSTFSSDIASASTKDKKAPVIQYLSNEKNNYTASKIISSAMTRLEEETRMSVDKSITTSLTDKLRAVPASLSTLNDGLGKLSDGANTLSSGMGQATGGAGQVASGASALHTGLQTLGGGASSLASGASAAADGAAQVASGASALNTGLQTLDSGAGSLASGASGAAAGASNLAGGASSLNAGLTQLQAQLQTTGSSTAPTLADQVNALNTGAKQVSSGLEQLDSSQGISAYTTFANGTLYASVLSNLKTLQTVAAATNTPMNQLVQTTLQSYQAQMKNDPSSAPAVLTLYEATSILSTNPALSESDFEKAMNAAATPTSPNLVSTGTTVTSSVDALATGSSKISAGTQKLFDSTQPGGDLNTSVDKLAAGSKMLTQGTSDLSSGLNTLSSGASQLAAGASNAASGGTALASGASQLSANMPALASGANQLASGTASALSGSETLASGAQQLLGGFSPLQNGAAQLANGLTSAKQGVSDNLSDANIQIQPLDGLDTYVSAPLKLQSGSIFHVPNYGTGFAPYFISISLWAGALMMIAGLQIGKGKPANPLQMRRFAMLRVAFYYVMSFLQGLVLSVLLPVLLHIQVQNIPLYMLANILIAFTFVSVILLCVTSFGVVGSFISVVLLVLQLTSSAGTFPLETTPAFFQAINPLLPMTYSVRLLREVISGFQGNSAAADVAYLLPVLLVVFTLNVIVTHIQTSRNITQARLEQAADMNI
ncbi:MAG: YhgE/Pip domain-containing protein [Ethanoligenens sp.]|uniref:YhgE/Pip domain-containing protein n=1 Tax=Ethanoligenens sp. TaxID=2099655 RepID=UPI0039EAC9AD